MAIRGTSITPTGVQLTERQSQVLALVRRHIDDTGYPPTRADIARELGFKSANAAEEHLKALARKGVIEMIPGTSRGIRLVLDAADEGLPLSSAVPWGPVGWFPVGRFPKVGTDFPLGVFFTKRQHRSTHILNACL